MWVEIGTGAGVVGLVTLIVRIQNARISRMNNHKVSTGVCEERHKAINNDLKRGEKQFGHILEKLSAMKSAIARIDERTKFLARQNGMKEEDD